MILVADASALIALATCDSLSLLDALFGQVLVPQAVYDEVAIHDKPQSARLHRYLLNKIRAVDMRRYVFLDAYADIGETQAMLLYKELDADFLLIDDRRGRKVVYRACRQATVAARADRRRRSRAGHHRYGHQQV